MAHTSAQHTYLPSQVASPIRFALHALLGAVCFLQTAKSLPHRLRGIRHGLPPPVRGDRVIVLSLRGSGEWTRARSLPAKELVAAVPSASLPGSMFWAALAPFRSLSQLQESSAHVLYGAFKAEEKLERLRTGRVC
jgi:hypothetical protein